MRSNELHIVAIKPEGTAALVFQLSYPGKLGIVIEVCETQVAARTKVIELLGKLPQDVDEMIRESGVPTGGRELTEKERNTAV